jgi:predicted small metal-binding protein
MYEFQCGSPVCHSQFKAGDKEELKRQMAEHVRTAHRIPAPTASILDYLVATAVTETTPGRTGG